MLFRSHKLKINHSEDSTRERKKFEKHVIKNKSGINEMFIITIKFTADNKNLNFNFSLKNNKEITANDQ